jgi:hypothetical protein
MGPDGETNRLTPVRPDEPIERTHCVDGPLFCEVRVISDAEWDALDPAERPERAEHFEGLGWVVAVPIQNVN